MRAHIELISSQDLTKKKNEKDYNPEMEICDPHNLNGIETGVGQKHYLTSVVSPWKVFGIVLWRITEGLMSTSWFKLRFGLTEQPLTGFVCVPILP